MPPPSGGDGLCFSRASDADIHADVDDSNAERIDVEVLDPNPTCFRGVESVFGASKSRKTENAQNEILDARS